MSDDNPWSYLQPNDVERFGPVILDPAEQKRWSSALFLGGLSYMWQKSTVLRDLIFLHLGLKPGGALMLTEIGFGPQFFGAMEMDLHVEYIFRKIVAGRQRELGDAAYYSIAELQTAFAGMLVDEGSFSWRSADLFWGRKPG